MKKIKYQGGLTKLITSEIGRRNKEKFTLLISKPERLNTLFTEVNKGTNIQMNMVSFSSSSDFSEQVLSILSFLRYVGMPLSWTILSDGSHTPEQIELLEGVLTFTKVEKNDLFDDKKVQNTIKSSLIPWKEGLLDYGKKFPLGKRLFLYLNHNIDLPTIFLDSDILFYKKASILNEILLEEGNGWFLPDFEWGCLDSQYKDNVPKQLYQVNAGFLIFNKNLSILTEGLEFLKNLKSKYQYFSEQTVVHILLKANSFMPLDPRIFILNSGDQFDFSYLYNKSEIAIRHYTGPVRHKMWQKDWKWHLSLS